MQKRVFDPLKMRSAGFGGSASRGKEDHPWGHRADNKPQPPGPGDDNPDVIGPAGTVHCSLADLATFVNMHATHQVGPVLKKAETFLQLQKIADGNKDYASGWVVLERAWAKGPALMHNGSNTMNYCVIWVAPQRRSAMIAVTNSNSDSAAPACDAVVSQLKSAFLPAGDPAPGR